MPKTTFGTASAFLLALAVALPVGLAVLTEQAGQDRDRAAEQDDHDTEHEEVEGPETEEGDEE